MRLVTLLFVVGCGGVSAESPLTVSLGAPRDQVISQLRTHKYCARTEQRPAKTEVYPRCDRAGSEWGESWVTATYDEDRLVELKRYERFTDDGRAIERWNQLIGERAKLTPESAEATAALRKHALEPGTRTVKVFRVDADTIAAVYLLTPTPPEEASVLEAVIRSPKP
jgi:hypothetical protein